MKRKKMQLSDLIAANINYFAFSRVKNAAGVKGWRYVLEKPLTTEQLEAVKKYNNVILSSCAYRYAPELTYSTIIILDKCNI